MFSQVREDPTVEMGVLERMSNLLNHNILVVGSGGCTAMALLGHGRSINLVDFNEDQLRLIRLKIEIMKYYRNPLPVLEGMVDMNVQSVLEISPRQDREYWNNNIDCIKTGINNCGVFEELFRELVRSDFDFDAVFSDQHLMELFGEDAVVNSAKNSFADHFRRVMNHYKSNCSLHNNYFYHQIMKGCYNPHDLPPYFSNTNNIALYDDTITYINTSMTDHLETTSNTYDMIQVSNLTDWMDVSKLNSFMVLIYNRLNDGGYVVMRRLNGDYTLVDIVSKYFAIVQNSPLLDKSYFYKEVIVAQRKSSLILS